MLKALWWLSFALLLAIPQTGFAQLNCVCPVVYLGPSGGGHAYYAIRYVNAANCNSGSPTMWIGPSPNLQGACIAPADCSNCQQLGSRTKPGEKLQPEPDASTNQTPAAATQPVALQAAPPQFTEVKVPVKSDFEFAPPERAGIDLKTVQMGAPITLRVCRTEDCSDAKYIRIFTYLMTRQEQGPREWATIMQLGFECEKPSSEKPLLSGVARPLEYYEGKEATPKVMKGYITILIGTSQIPVKVNDATEWLP